MQQTEWGFPVLSYLISSRHRFKKYICYSPNCVLTCVYLYLSTWFPQRWYRLMLDCPLHCWYRYHNLAPGHVHTTQFSRVFLLFRTITVNIAVHISSLSFSITGTSHEIHGISNHWQLSCFVQANIKKIKNCITGPLCCESASDWWIPHTKSQ